MRTVDMTGVRVGRLVGLRPNGSIRNRKQWICRCDCGNEVESDGPYLRQALRHGAIASCGCYKLERSSAMGKAGKTHGFTTTDSKDKKLYDVWKQMRRRCELPTNRDYPRYGARGIKVCSEWLDIAAFVSWAHQAGYAPGLTIDRTNFDGDYEPSNCTWIPMPLQGKNTSRCYFITFNGDTLNLSDWAKKTGIGVRTLIGRKNRGWPAERMLTEPSVRGTNQFSKSPCA